MSDNERDLPDDSKESEASSSGDFGFDDSKDSQDSFAKNLDKLNRAMISGALANKLSHRLQDHSHELRESLKRFSAQKAEAESDEKASAKKPSGDWKNFVSSIKNSDFVSKFSKSEGAAGDSKAKGSVSAGESKDKAAGEHKVEHKAEGSEAASAKGAGAKAAGAKAADAQAQSSASEDAAEVAKREESNATRSFLESLDQKFPGVTPRKQKATPPPPPPVEEDEPQAEEDSLADDIRWKPIRRTTPPPPPLGETDNLKAVETDEPKKLSFTRLGSPITRLPAGTKVLKNSMRDVRSTVDALNAGERIDPTRPTIAIFVVLSVAAMIISITTLVGTSALPSARLPFSNNEPAVTDTAEETTEAAPSETEGAEEDEQKPAPQGPAPQIESIDVISYNKDGGDHQEWADRMIDGDTSTRWQTRYFAQPDLPEDQTIRLIIHLKENSLVHKVTLKGPIDGGQVDLRINDGKDPFGTPVVTSSQMSATTTLAPSEPQMGNTVTLNFVSLPTEDEGRYRVKIDELRVE